MCLVVTIGAIPYLPEMDLSSPDLVKYWGYPIEIHHVTTEDGYILEMHRIPHGKTNSTRMPTRDNPKPVFILHHPLASASSTFILNLPHQSLGFVLADAGFDVWMGNARGNRYSKQHNTLDPKSEEYWDFTFQEMGEFDCPAMIDYALNATNQKQVYFVGHSQGTVVAFTALAENEELQDKIKVFFATGPVTRVSKANDFVHLLASYRRTFRFICKVFDIHEVLGSASQATAFARRFCPYIPNLCSAFLFILNGFDDKRLNTTRVPLYLSNIPSGTSVKNMDHYFQMVLTKEFKKYDHGTPGNMNRYGSDDPPFYDISEIDTPVVMLYGSEDTIIDPDDVDWAAKQLPNVKKMMIDGYNHLDFIIATDAAESVYNKIIDIARLAEKGLLDKFE